jgi:hypothetical protein
MHPWTLFLLLAALAALSLLPWRRRRAVPVLPPEEAPVDPDEVTPELSDSEPPPDTIANRFRRAVNGQALWEADCAFRRMRKAAIAAARSDPWDSARGHVIIPADVLRSLHDSACDLHATLRRLSALSESYDGRSCPCEQTLALAAVQYGAYAWCIEHAEYHSAVNPNILRLLVTAAYAVADRARKEPVHG